MSIQPFRPFKKKGTLESSLAPERKIFEGEFKIHFYNDRVTANAYCWHCKSKIHQEFRITKAQFNAIEKDEQYRKNVCELLVDRIQENHQCGLLHEGKDLLNDVFKKRGA